MRTFVIAELGSCWLYSRVASRNYYHGLKLIGAANDAGASAIKMQWVSDHRKLEARRKVIENSYVPLAWPQDWHNVFAQYAHELKMEYIVTCFLPQDAAVLFPVVDRFKVASLEWQSKSLRRAMSSQPKPVIYSTGVTKSVNGLVPPHATDRLLHCVAAYPCPPEQMNLAAMRVYGFANSYDGLSDHSGNVLTGAFAVMRGATIIEAHIRLDETPKSNPDFPHALSPSQFKDYVANIQLAEAMLGDGKKRIMPGEKALMKHRVRR